MDVLKSFLYSPSLPEHALKTKPITINDQVLPSLETERPSQKMARLMAVTEGLPDTQAKLSPFVGLTVHVPTTPTSLPSSPGGLLTPNSARSLSSTSAANPFQFMIGRSMSIDQSTTSKTPSPIKERRATVSSDMEEKLAPRRRRWSTANYNNNKDTNAKIASLNEERLHELCATSLQ